MASPNLSQQASTPANSKRKTSAMPFHSPPRGPMPAWNAKLDALGRCYEGELAEDQRRLLGKGAVETFLARKQNEATKDTRISEAKSHVGTSRDAVLANLRLLGEAHQRLTASPRNTSVQYGKEKLSLGEILPIFDDLSKLWQEKVEKPVANLNKSDAILVQRNELLGERDNWIEQMKAARQERDRSRQERDLYLNQKKLLQQERDALLQERDQYRQESEILKREREELQLEVQKSRQQRLEKIATKASLGVGMIPRRVLNEVERERDDSHRRGTRYRQERDKARGEYDSVIKKSVQYQTRSENMERELDSVKLQLNSSTDTNKTLDADLNVLKRTFYQERQALKSQFDTLKSAHIAKTTELDQTRNELSHALATNRRNLESELRQQRTLLQGTHNTKTQWMRARLNRDHELNVRTLTQNWEQEKAQLVASAAADREAVKHLALTAKKTKESYSVAFEIQLNKLSLSRETSARAQQATRDLVIAIAVLRYSYKDMHDALERRRRTITDHIDQTHELGKQLTDLQEEITESKSESSRLQMKLRNKEKELDMLSAANKANTTSLGEIQKNHAVCENDRRLQLGRIDRLTFFEDFSSLAKSLSANGMVFRGQETGRDVDVCFCVLPRSDEALCLIRMSAGVFIVWHSKMEDWSTFSHAWHRWLCLGGKNQGKTLYICLANAKESEEWLQRTLAVRTVSGEEAETFKRTKRL